MESQASTFVEVLMKLFLTIIILSTLTEIFPADFLKDEKISSFYISFDIFDI